MNIEKLCMSCFEENMIEGKCESCGFTEGEYFCSPHHLPLKTILAGRYFVGKVLGEGGFGITYIGYDLNLEMKVAIKEYYPNGCVTRENTGTKTVYPYAGEKGEYFIKGKEKFLGEAKTLARFSNFPGIVSVRDFFMENQTAYIVMEYVEGKTIKEYLQEVGGKIPTDKMFQLMLPVMQSLGKIHQTGIIHRDISPDNIMIDNSNQIKLLDFGAARDYIDSGNKSLSVMLKPGYAPEEQYRSRGIQGPWTDVYALCATIYRSITGVVPLESNERVIDDDLVPPSQLGVKIQGYEEDALMKGLAVFQRNRYEDILELVADMYPTEEALSQQVDKKKAEKEKLVEEKAIDEEQRLTDEKNRRIATEYVVKIPETKENAKKQEEVEKQETNVISVRPYKKLSIMGGIVFTLVMAILQSVLSFLAYAYFIGIGFGIGVMGIFILIIMVIVWFVPNIKEKSLYVHHSKTFNIILLLCILFIYMSGLGFIMNFILVPFIFFVISDLMYIEVSSKCAVYNIAFILTQIFMLSIFAYGFLNIALLLYYIIYTVFFIIVLKLGKKRSWSYWKKIFLINYAPILIEIILVLLFMLILNFIL